VGQIGIRALRDLRRAVVTLRPCHELRWIAATPGTVSSNARKAGWACVLDSELSDTRYNMRLGESVDYDWLLEQ